MFCGSVIGIPSEIISPKTVAELHPLLNVHDLVGALHVPEDAVVSSADVALALASAASQNGEQEAGKGWGGGDVNSRLERLLMSAFSFCLGTPELGFRNAVSVQ